MHALVADELDLLEEDNPEGFDIGVVAFAIEVITPDPENPGRCHMPTTRAHGAYAMISKWKRSSLRY
jgi:hypothetical protein